MYFFEFLIGHTVCITNDMEHDEMTLLYMTLDCFLFPFQWPNAAAAETQWGKIFLKSKVVF